MRLLPAALAFVALSALPVRAQSVEEFYKGKTINLAIGFSVGGGYDLYARHLARHMGKHIPGNPAIVPQNMAGAGSLRAANSSTRRRRRTAPRSAPSPAPPGSIRCWKAARPSTAPSSPGSAASPTTSAFASPGTPRR